MILKKKAKITGELMGHPSYQNDCSQASSRAEQAIYSTPFSILTGHMQTEFFLESVITILFLTW